MRTEIVRELLRFGTVWFASQWDGYGFITPDDWTGRKHIADPGRLRFYFQDGRDIVAGVEVPEFSEPLISPRLRGGDEADKLVFQVTYGYSSAVVTWGFRSQYEAALASIAARPVYRVVQLAYYQGKPTESAQVLCEGTLEQLRMDFSGRRLPSKILDFVYNYGVEVKVGGIWKACDDAQVRTKLELPPIQASDGMPRLTEVDLAWLVRRLDLGSLVMSK